MNAVQCRAFSIEPSFPCRTFQYIRKPTTFNHVISMKHAALLFLFIISTFEISASAATVRVAAIQCYSKMGETSQNTMQLIPLIRQAAAGGAKIIVTPECAVQGYMYPPDWTTWTAQSSSITGSTRRGPPGDGAWCSEGKRPIQVVDTPYGRLGLMICFDFHVLPPKLVEHRAGIVLYSVGWYGPNTKDWFSNKFSEIVVMPSGFNVVAANWSGRA